MSNVKHLQPLKSIPYMLRFWADMLESGEEAMPKSISMICVYDGNTPPTVYGAGVDMNRLENAGALFFCINQTLGTDVSS